MLKLQAHSSNPSNDFNIEIDYKISEENLHINFYIQKLPLKTSEKFSSNNWDNWGLWEFDVAEVFLSKHQDPNRYIELQVSPLSQKFALNIYEPRKKYEKVTKLKVNAHSKITHTGFIARFDIPIDEIPGSLDSIRGNFCACLHANDQYYFYALNINKEDKANFHRPDLFLELNK